MASLTTSFHYEVTATLITDDNKEIDIPVEGIKTITTKYRYDTSNMPAIYLGIRVSSKLFSRMVKDIDTANIILSVYKYDSKSVSSIRKKYIQERFVYFMPTDANYKEALEDLAEGGTNVDSGTNYRQGTLGLLKIDCMNNNKNHIINDIIKNSNIASIIHKYTNHMNMVIEPFDENKILDTFIIPPIESITRLIEYINNSCTLYKSGYRYFRDFNRTYLLSLYGNPVDANDTTFNTIIIRILPSTNDTAKTLSMEIDQKQKCYILNIDANYTNISIDKMKDKSYNTIMGITSTGETDRAELNISKNKDSIEKVKLQRTYNDNLDYIKNLKSGIESSSVLVNITKTEIDSSLLTPNKEYLIQNYSTYKEYNGRFLLSYKQEILVQQNGEFISSTIFGLRKVMGE